MPVFRATFRIFKSHVISTKLSKKSSQGFQFNVKAATGSSDKFLVSYHLKNHRLDQARVVFDGIRSPDVQLCSMMITGYARNGRISDAMMLFDKMRHRDFVAWNSMIKGCLDCGDLAMARSLFDEMPEKNVVSWTTMVDGYLRYGRFEVAESLFWDMPVRDVAAWNVMIYGYCEYGRIEESMKLFEEMPCRNVISWTSMIAGLDQNGKSEEALSLFREMMDSGVEPTSNTLASVLTACANVADSNLGTQVHGLVVKLGYLFDEFISASLMTWYAKCKEVDYCRKVFNEIVSRNPVIWTALLSGYSVNCKHEDALRVFCIMIKVNVLPNQATFISALNSCCELEALDKGREIHTVAFKLGLDTDVYVGNSLLIMYHECGNIHDALAEFKIIKEKNVVSWNAIITGSAQHGYAIWALIFYTQMIRAGVDPDEITFTGILSACNHSGLLQKGRCFFKYISRYKVTKLKLQHYACMVDILSRSGKLDEAEELLRNIPMQANSMVWLALLSACRIHSNIAIAERAAKCIFELEPHCSAAYVLLSNLYASAGRWEDVLKMRAKMKEGRAMKVRGSSWVVLKGRRHEFLSADRSHPQTEKIYEKLDWLGGKLKEFGYIPDPNFVLHDVEDEQKEETLSYHSERLAIAFGLVNSVEGSVITVMKNLRVCGDCHAAIKIMSKIVSREIVVRDPRRFHHFKKGICSCGDYW
ncbi:hypothetical protein K2173_001394 [Erythroxylum novogranatense]|uniref:DYW domain-containing protein n=1 Tax=Erythroxylum novogranatense TaxID=1862640 RepID=A0AAV8T458_9ROSI|nr:hypothetical protein K2173_001394 [Erythroxylum novogranatense]